MHVNVMGGMNFATYDGSSSASTSYSAKGAISGGSTIDFGIAPVISFETGLLSIGQSTKSTVSGLGELTQVSRALEIPLMLRFDALPLLSLGVGGYYAMINSKYKIQGSTIALLPDGEYTIDKSQNETTDYGLRFGGRLLLPLAPMVRALIDASYDMGLKDLDKGASTSKTKQYALMVGASFGF